MADKSILDDDSVQLLLSEGKIEAAIEIAKSKRPKSELTDDEIKAQEKVMEFEKRVKARRTANTGGLLSDDMPMENPEETHMMPDGTIMPGATHEEYEQEMLPEDTSAPLESDEAMEDNYIDFIVDESLDEDEEDYLYQKLEGDEQLSVIFDKVLEVASEFAGSGPIEGPGTGVSDSIPARLSDGEFVFTAKAVEEIGVDNLQQMMETAEMQADEEPMRQARRSGGYMTEDLREGMTVAPEKTYDLDKAEVEDTNNRINDKMITGGVPIR